MKFTPTEKNDWLQSIKLNEDYQKFNDEQLSSIYEAMVEEANRGMIAAAALGGKWEPGEPDYNLLKAKNISNAPAERLVQVFKELYSEYEKNLRNMFNDSRTELSISPQQVAEALHRYGLDEYASQVYILFGGMYAGCAYNIKNVIQDVKGWVAAYRMADELNVNVSEIEPLKALEYYKIKNHES
ncbi:hypothetical protein [Bacteroides fragilis]|jgi:hypothetical protein|uniref:hypothetical protein n=1 Tax=Bacteroides fragilis TaxID=817 RepID=UPI00202E2567|nr:hypothetical protein [Bacteroides fragilis]DAZ13133.1 MAG TPA: hypothetical protein [Caudoviricetes sp.]